MKRICVILAAALLLSVFQPCYASSGNQSAENSAGGYIVKLKETKENSASLMALDMGLREVCGEAGIYHADTLSEIAELGDMVEYYEPDCMVTLSALPNDTYASKEWSIGNLEADYAWEKGYNGEGVRVAVIDSGVNSLHEDFDGTVFDKGLNKINGSHDVTDEMGHGTFVSGVLGAARNNGIGVAGLCTGATIVPIKCFGKSVETNASYIISAVYDAVDVYDCDVINLSLGMTADMQSMKDAVEYAAGKGVIIVSAVGNSGTSQLNYPAAYDCVVGVGSINQSGQVASFSQKNSSVYVVAPGVGLVGLKNTSYNAYEFNGNGTSYSTPHATMAAVILKQYAPFADYQDFEAILRQSAIDRGTKGYDTSYGYGCLNIKNFIQVMEAYDFGDVGDAFPDIKGHWAEENIKYCVNQKLFTGVTSSRFMPEINMTRAMFVTVLSRMSGENISGFPNMFSDVDGNAWYAQPCGWGAATGIVSGTGNGVFSPEGNVTREQMAVFLYRYANLYNLTDGAFSESVLYNYSDRGKVSPWAKDALAWAVGNGLITGRTENTLCPQDSAKRCEVAAIIFRFLNNFNGLA